MFGNRERHPPEELHGGRVRQWVAGASVAAALIAVALFFGEELFSTAGVLSDHTASIGASHSGPSVRQ